MDYQKNLRLPNLPDQSAYFSQQYNLYNFTVVNGTSNTQLNQTSVTAYVWTDLDLPKNASVIASALFHKLTTHQFSEAITEIFIFADGCPGQTKNITMIGMLASFLQRKAPKNIRQIQVIFPIVGHSFMPPDRVFGISERKIKNSASITDPGVYHGIIAENATVLKLSEDWDAYDWKTAVLENIKAPGAWHFQFQPCKRFIIIKKNHVVEVQGEVSYNSESGVSKGVLKKGKKLSAINPDVMDCGRISDKNKAKSVSKLLENHYGKNWQDDPTLSFYTNAINFALNNDESNSNLLTNEMCTELAGNNEEVQL